MESSAAATDRIAAELLAAWDENRQVAPVSAREPDFDLAAARAVAARIRKLREARGERVVGRKIGFTNRTIWPVYGVWAPIWGEMYEGTVSFLDEATARVPLPPRPEPRIEPEIVLGLSAQPHGAMSEAEIAASIDWVAHGFEVVTSVYPGWRFAAADTQAAHGLHAALFVGPRLPAATLGDDPVSALAGLRITLTGENKTVQGQGSDVLDGPVQALRHLLVELDRLGEPPLGAGDIVTTGTLTDAQPLVAGARWQTAIEGVRLPGLDVTFVA